MSSVKEIARLAGVSTGTVDRVLNNHGRFSEKTRETIIRIVKELNYQPNIYAQNLRRKRTQTFGVIMPASGAFGTAYWDLPMKGIKQSAKELSDKKIKVEYFLYKTIEQIETFDIDKNIIQQHIDGLLIVPAFYDIFKTFVKKIPRNVPYVFIDSTIKNAKNVTYIGQDACLSGTISAKLLKMMIPGGGKIVIVGVVPSDHHIDNRIKGFIEYFDNNPDYILEKHFLDRLTASANQEMPMVILKQHPDVKGFFIPGSRFDILAHYLEKNKPAEKVCIIGYDLVPDNRELLEKGLVDFIIGQSPEEQGYQGLCALYKHTVLRQKLQKEILLPVDVIMKETLSYY